MPDISFYYPDPNNEKTCSRIRFPFARISTSGGPAEHTLCPKK
jgi:hypothetical protein